MNSKKSLQCAIIVTILVSLFFVCQASAEEGKFVVLDVKNPQFNANELFPAFENYYSPRIWKLREKYGLDAVVEGEKDEFKRILLLRNWIYSNVEKSDNAPDYAREDALAILDLAFKGGRFHCTHTSLLGHAVLNSYGYPARRLGCGQGLKSDGTHHGMNEVWVNSLCKWVLVDAEYDCHYEKDGVPLSALEIRDEVWKDGAKSVTLVMGPQRTPTEVDTVNRKWADPCVYRWCSWEPDTNRFTAFPAYTRLSLIMYDDEIFRNNTWYRGGDRPHWAYNTPHLITTTLRESIEWTPNVIRADIKIRNNAEILNSRISSGRGEMKAYESQINGDSAVVFLVSFTPNFKTYQLKKGDGQWVDCDEVVEIRLKKELNRFAFRTVNLFGVAGPEYRVEIDWQQ
jgi:hypothetical protein